MLENLLQELTKSLSTFEQRIMAALLQTPPSSAALNCTCMTSQAADQRGLNMHPATTTHEWAGWWNQPFLYEAVQSSFVIKMFPLWRPFLVLPLPRRHRFSERIVAAFIFVFVVSSPIIQIVILSSRRPTWGQRDSIIEQLMSNVSARLSLQHFESHGPRVTAALPRRRLVFWEQRSEGDGEGKKKMEENKQLAGWK